MPKLNETDLVLLSIASQREDHLIVAPEGLEDAGRRKLAGKLMRSGMAEEVATTRDELAWRVMEEGERRGLKITPEGLAAIGLEVERDPTVRKGGRSKNGSRSASEGKASWAMSSRVQPKAPRDESKKAGIIALLRRKSGATLAELIESTGWLPHTTRAALTGLRKSGYELEKSKNKAGQTVYRTTSMPEFGKAGR